MSLRGKTALIALAIAGILSGEPGLSMRSVDGVVTDKRGNPLPGAVVQLENNRDLSIRSFITQKDGHYYFGRLHDDIDYTLQAHYFRYWSQPRTLSKFNSSPHPQVNLVFLID